MMRLDGERESENVDDVRGQSGGGGGGGGFGFGGGGGGGGGGMIGLLIGFVISRFGIGGIIVVGIVALVFGFNPLTLLGGGGAGSGGGQTEYVPRQQVGQPQGEAPGAPAKSDATSSFIRKVLNSTEDTWNKVLPEQAGIAYPEPTLVLFSRQWSSACGGATAATGPFYCPADRKVYLDASFFDELSQRFGAPGDFAAAYVIAHEIGHHIQQVLGISDRAQEAMSRGSRAQRNAVSVRLELQADCLAGIWAKDNADQLDPGDVEEAVAAATAIGDDRLQREAQGTVVPDSFTHGSSAQRVRWLKQGMAAGTLKGCDTFSADTL